MQSIEGMKLELKERLDQLNRQGRLFAAQRLEQRTKKHLKCWSATGSCAGIENYSRYLSQRRPGEPPPTLFEYLPDNALVFADESHVTIPQIGGMYRGDDGRKATLAGGRLPPAVVHAPSAAAVRGMGGRPGRTTLMCRRRRDTGRWSRPGGVFVEQVIRPTGLIDTRAQPGRRPP